MADLDRWIADRTRNVDSSGIRKMFDLAANLTDPINLSIGQPDFDIPPPIKSELIAAIEAAGFEQVELAPVKIDQSVVAEAAEQLDPGSNKTFDVELLKGTIFSAKVTARKPGA